VCGLNAAATTLVANKLCKTLVRHRQMRLLEIERDHDIE
jgi:hypothetical protein